MTNNSTIYSSNGSLDCMKDRNSKNYFQNLLTARDILWITVPPVFLTLGIPGNLLTMLVIFRQRKTISFTAVVLLFIAVADTIFLVTWVLADWVGILIGYTGTNDNDCQTFVFLSFVSATMSHWGLVVITVQRVVSVVWPYKAKSLFMPKMALFIVIGIAFLSMGLYGYVFEVYGHSEKLVEIYGISCGPLPVLGGFNLSFEIWNSVLNCIIFLCPFFVLSIGNSVMLYRLYLFRKRILTNTENRVSKNNRYVLVVLLNVVFFISQFPLALFLLLEENVLNNWVFAVDCIDLKEYKFRQNSLNLAYACVTVLSYLNPSFNFVLYAVSSPKFRSEIKSMLLCKMSGKDAFDDELTPTG